MCGLPVTLTYDERVQITLNLDRIRWLKVDDAVQAHRIAQGMTAPAEYYQAITGDTEAGSNLMGMSILAKMMGG